MSLPGILLMACAGTLGSTEVEGKPSWRPATVADIVPGLEQALGETLHLGEMIDLAGGGRLVLVRVEVDDSVGAARVAMVDGPVLGMLPAPPQGHPAVTSGLWVHPPGRLPVRERMPAELVMFAAEHAVVEWCLPPPGQPWTVGNACYGSAIVGLEGGEIRRFELWD